MWSSKSLAHLSAAISAAVLCTCLFANCASADLYTAPAASLEWKVDSADEIYLTEVIEDNDAQFGLRFRPLQALKAGSSLDSFPHHTVHRCRLGNYLNPRFPVSAKETRWLIFVRGAGDEARISGAIYLSHPTLHWSVAAISGVGEGDDRILRTPKSIVQAVQQRIGRQLPMPADCDADLTDQLYASTAVHAPFAKWFGGKLLDINNTLWDEENTQYGTDYDTLVTPLLVPLDVPQGAALGERRLETLHDTEVVPLFDSSAAFVRTGIPEDNHSLLIGTWVAVSSSQKITITFQHRLTCLYHVEQTTETENAELKALGGACFGAGSWSVRNRTLTVRTETQVDTRWRSSRDWSYVYEAKLPHGKITTSTADEFTLEDGTVFTRTNKPLRVYDFPHDHPWYVVSAGWGLHRVNLKLHALFNTDDNSAPQPLNNLVLLWLDRGSPPMKGAPRPKHPNITKVLLKEDGFQPRVAIIRAGDTFEIEATGSQLATGHNINLPWVRNQQRGFAPRLDPPLIYQETVMRGEPGLMTFHCNIHDDEQGYLAVTEHGNAAVTDDTGFATLNYWPIGRQKIRLSHPDYVFGSAKVWANGEEVEKNGAAIWLELGSEDIELKIHGAQASQR